MKVACIGGGPGGLFLSILLKRKLPDSEVTVFERNRADDTFGFGVVFSDATLAAIHDADPVLREALDDHGVHWDEIEVRLKGEIHRCGGNGMAAVVRSKLLELMQRRAERLGVDVRFETEASPDQLDGYDLIVGSDGANSTVRATFPTAFPATVDTASAKFIWFGTTYLFDGLTFLFRRSEYGVFAVHGYPISDSVSTFIVETDEETWEAAGLDEFDVSAPPGPSDERSMRYLQELFAPDIDGQELLANNSRWGNFRTLRVASWSHGRIALLGDSAHTAHFSVGSGTKMAMEDAISLATALESHPGDVPTALEVYEADARPSVDRIQGAAGPSLSWWERFGRYHEAFEPWQFTIHFLTRSIDVSRLARRDPELVEDTRAAWRAQHGAEVLSSPLAIGPSVFPARVVDVDDHNAPSEVRALGVDVAFRLDGPTDGQLWGRAVEAPDDDDPIPALAAIEAATDEGAALIAVYGGDRLSRTLLAEEARFAHGLPVVVVDPTASVSDAETLILTGRADLVAGAGVDR